MNSLENLGHRHNDALSRVGWVQLEHLLATYYREVGWWVEHAATAATGTEPDGSVGLKIRRDAEIVLVQCRHWNASEVQAAAVHELLDLTVDEGATGAILVCNGAFTSVAVAAAQRHSHVKLIDGDTLRTMLGPLPEPASHPDTPMPAPAPARRPSEARPRSNRWPWLVALVCAVAFALIVRAILNRTADTAVEPPQEAIRAPAPPPAVVVYPPQPAEPDPTATKPPPRSQTEAEIRVSQRRADDAMRLIEDDTPEI